MGIIKNIHNILLVLLVLVVLTSIYNYVPFELMTSMNDFSYDHYKIKILLCLLTILSIFRN